MTNLYNCNTVRWQEDRGRWMESCPRCRLIFPIDMPWLNKSELKQKTKKLETQKTMFVVYSCQVSCLCCIIRSINCMHEHAHTHTNTHQSENGPEGITIQTAFVHIIQVYVTGYGMGQSSFNYCFINVGFKRWYWSNSWGDPEMEEGFLWNDIKIAGIDGQ